MHCADYSYLLCVTRPRGTQRHAPRGATRIAAFLRRHNTPDTAAFCESQENKQEPWEGNFFCELLQIPDSEGEEGGARFGPVSGVIFTVSRIGVRGADSPHWGLTKRKGKATSNCLWGELRKRKAFETSFHGQDGQGRRWVPSPAAAKRVCQKNLCDSHGPTRQIRDVDKRCKYLTRLLIIQELFSR